MYEYGEYIIYGDETGDQSLKTIYKDHPIFLLALCIFSKQDYITEVVTRFKELKFTFWGHDGVVLHSAKLRKQIEDFQFLQNQKRRAFFIETLNTTMQASPFTVISTGVNKLLLAENYLNSQNPYELSLEACLLGVYSFLQEKGQMGKTTHIIIESRGTHVDKDLEVAFDKIVQKTRAWQDLYPLKILFLDKRANNIGLQIADLVAYPLGRFLVDPQRTNLAFEIVREKLYKYPDYLEQGLKILPLQDALLP